MQNGNVTATKDGLAITLRSTKARLYGPAHDPVTAMYLPFDTLRSAFQKNAEQFIFAYWMNPEIDAEKGMGVYFDPTLRRIGCTRYSPDQWAKLQRLANRTSR